jgi:hypothetical protein
VAKVEFFEDPRGKIFALGGANEEHPRMPGFESVSVPSRSNITDLRIVM